LHHSGSSPGQQDQAHHQGKHESRYSIHNHIDASFSPGEPYSAVLDCTD
jgi:hypothetical protein